MVTVRDKNDETPACSPRTHHVTFSENLDVTTPATLATLACADAEVAPNGGALDYSIISVNGATPGPQFTVDSTGTTDHLKLVCSEI